MLEYPVHVGCKVPSLEKRGIGEIIASMFGDVLVVDLGWISDIALPFAKPDYAVPSDGREHFEGVCRPELPISRIVPSAYQSPSLLPLYFVQVPLPPRFIVVPVVAGEYNVFP
jgi:hypothetical protein